MELKLGELASKLGIEIIDPSPDHFVGRMPVAGNRQPFGRLHGGATAALGETLGSLAATAHAAGQGRIAVGVDVNTTHYLGVRDGHVTGTARPLHLGEHLTSHEVTVEDDSGRLIATVRITNMLLDPGTR
ncbi:MAG: hotdog fold thioesterase [Bifidobacteriaceae bacterium]|nr:hotdog fold thioesterase [Bifidobacteriaceae bacterium]